MQAIRASAIVMTKNEAKNLPTCLERLSRFQEVFVVDSGSTDDTLDIARRYGATVVTFEWNGQYPKKKQWCLSNLDIATDWVLYVDADELVTDVLQDELAQLLSGGIPDCNAYYVLYHYVFLGKILRHGWQPRKLVLLRKGYAHFLERDDLAVENFWEVEGHYQPEVLGPVGTLRSKMLHNDHDSLFDYFARHNRYTEWEAHLNVFGAPSAHIGSQRDLRSLAKLVLRRMPLRGLAFLVYSYLIRQGFRDGRPGLDFAIVKSIYYWEISLKERALRREKKLAQRV
jgi:glycosyltransferase involved in cell wall biosynthesis